MEVYSPSTGLMIWSFLALVNLLVCVFAIIKIANDKFIEPGKKIIWLLAIIAFPFIGAIVFFALYKKGAHPKA